MAICPRCRDAKQQPRSTCTQCGWDVGPEDAPPISRAGGPSPSRVVLWLVLFILLAVLLAVVIAYVQGVKQLGR
jgi:uncharacterized protein (DUF983 family)